MKETELSQGFTKTVREFDTGATRDTDEGKLDYEAYFSPLVLQRRAEYMRQHSIQKDGQVRSGDNWQKGMPFQEYMKSLVRHTMDQWLNYRTQGGDPVEMEELLCAIMFNAEGALYELLHDRY